MSEPQIEELLTTWEGNYKKGLLTLWLLLILNDREAYAFEMSRLISELSQGTITADENSLYRAMNRFEELGIVTSSWHDSEVGPRRRYYRLSPTGLELLQRFLRRNILLFQTEAVSKRIQAALNGTADSK
jgi:DNA-binding PadR family transcriptional regulator